VQLRAPLSVLRRRLDGDDRAALGKLTDLERLGQLVRHLDLSPLHASDLRIDTAETNPEDAARAILNALRDDSTPS
ncbi:MAG: hypothetical protein ACRDVW_10780, partial [Acidimicrobiales bacterium]